MGRLVDIDALTIGSLEALANERGMRLITKEAYADLRGEPTPDSGLDVDWAKRMASALYRGYDYTVTPEDILAAASLSSADSIEESA